MALYIEMFRESVNYTTGQWWNYKNLSAVDVQSDNTTTRSGYR